MELFLRTLLRLSVLGSLLAAALAVLRPLLRGRVSRRAAYYLWLLVLLRLCVPVGIGLSVPVAAEVPGIPDAPSVPAVPDVPELWDSQEVSRPTPEPAHDGTALPASPLPDAPDLPEVPDAPLPPNPPDWSREPGFWAAVWAAGALVSVGWFLLGYWRVSGTVLRSAGEVSPEARAVLREMAGESRVELVESEAVSTPLLLGVVRPVIVLPVGVTDPARLRDILDHELTHVRRHDLALKWFAALVTSLHWFNPVMLLVRREIGRCCELACDEAVMEGMDETARRHYGETLLELAAHAPRGLGSLAVTLCEEKKQLKERLLCIARFKKSGPMVIFLSLVLAAVVGACSLVNDVKTVTPDAPEPSDMPPEEEPQKEDSEPPVLYELDGGLTLAIPADIADRLLVFTSGKECEYWSNDVSVFEKESYEAAEGMEGVGYLFGITRYTSEQYEESLSGDGSGISPFATDGASYYMHTFATDVQFYRNSDSYENVDFTPWYELEDRVGGILEDFVTRNSLTPYSSLNQYAEVLYQNITKETTPDSRDYDFIARVEHNGQFDEFHITGENGYNVAFVGNYLWTYEWQEAEESEWLALANPGTVLTLISADGETSIRCRSGDDMAALTSNGETRYAHVWSPDMPEDPDPHLMYSLFSFMLTIPDDAFNQQVWTGTVDGSLSPADAATALAEQVAENYRNTPDWLDWKPLDFQVESVKVIDVYKGEEPNFCFWGNFGLRLDDPNYMQWQAGSGLDEAVAEGPYAGYFSWAREIMVEKNSSGDWYIADYGTGGYSVEFPGWSWSSGVENSLDNASLEELADLFLMTEGWSHDYLLPAYICQRPAEELAGLNDLLARHTEAEAQDLCRTLAAYFNAGFGESNHDTLHSVEDLNALLSPVYQAYTADVPPYGGE